MLVLPRCLHRYSKSRQYGCSEGMRGIAEDQRGGNDEDLCNAHDAHESSSFVVRFQIAQTTTAKPIVNKHS